MNKRPSHLWSTGTDTIARYIVALGVSEYLKGIRELIIKKASIGILFITFFSSFSILAIWWSLTVRISMIEEKNANMSAIAVLEHEVMELQRSWSDDDFEKLLIDISESELFVFPNFRVIAEWLYEEGNFANDAGLDLKYHLSDVVSDHVLEGVDMVPIKIQLESPIVESTHGYMRMMKFLKRMDKSSWKHEIVNASMTREGDGVTKMNVQFNVWMQTSNDHRSVYATRNKNDLYTSSKD